MVDQKIIDEVAKAFRNQETARTVRERLMLQGVAPEDVDEAVEHIIKHYAEFRYGPTPEQKSAYRTIFIGGIIVTLCIFSVYTWRVNRAGARDAQRIADIGRIQIALESYARHTEGLYPETLPMLVPLDIQQLPSDPASGEPYEYIVSADRMKYRLCMQYQSATAPCLGTLQKAPTR